MSGDVSWNESGCNDCRIFDCFPIPLYFSEYLVGTEQKEVDEASANIELRQEIGEEIILAVTKMKEGLALFDSAVEQNKQPFVEVQKSLLYIQSLI